ncbi:MAG TPA: hypothetical protein VK973_10275, partial [Arenicellales bacterium]|nr:hypothetical protein [Arenicellales bacterium]
LRKDLVNPPAQPIAKGLKPTDKIPAKADTNPLKAGTTSGVVDTRANDLRIAPGTGLKRDLVAPDVKDLAVRPQFREGISENLKEDLASRLQGGSATGDNLQGLAGNTGSRIGDDVGLGERLKKGNSVGRTLNESLNGYNRPDPGGRRSRASSYDGFDYALDNGIVGESSIFEDQRTDHHVHVVVLTQSEAEENLIGVEDLQGLEHYDDSTGESYGTIIVPDGSTHKEKTEYVKTYADTVRAEAPPELVPLTSGDDGTSDGADDQSNENDGGTTSSSGGDNGSSDGSGSASGDDADAGDGGEGDQDTATADQGCPEGDEDCGEAGDSEGGGERSVDGGPENPSSCEEGADCSKVTPDDESGDGTVRTAGRQEDERGGPLKGDADTTPANGTLRLANEEEVGGELVRGGDALRPAADGTLRLPEGEDDDQGGMPQVAGGAGGGPVGDPGVVTENVRSAGQLDNQEIQVNTNELNVDAQALEGVSQQATQ